MGVRERQAERRRILFPLAFELRLITGLELSSHPTRSLLRGRQTSAHRGIPLSLGLTESRPQQERLGNSQPEDLRRLMLKASSNPTGCSIGWSPALTPLKIRSTSLAERRAPAPVVSRSGHERYRSYFMRPLRAPTCFCRSLSWLAS